MKKMSVLMGMLPRVLNIGSVIVALLGLTSAKPIINPDIVTPVSVAKTEDMEFGTIIITGNGGSIILTPAGTYSAHGAKIPVSKGNVTAACLSVTGQPGTTYAITLPPSCKLTNEDNEIITVGPFRSSPNSTGILNAEGKQMLRIGATLNLNAGQAGGVYTSESGMPIIINYN